MTERERKERVREVGSAGWVVPWVLCLHCHWCRHCSGSRALSLLLSPCAEAGEASEAAAHMGEATGSLVTVGDAMVDTDSCFGAAGAAATPTAPPASLSAAVRDSSDLMLAAAAGNGAGAASGVTAAETLTSTGDKPGARSTAAPPDSASCWRSARQWRCWSRWGPVAPRRPAPAAACCRFGSDGTCATTGFKSGLKLCGLCAGLVQVLEAALLV